MKKFLYFTALMSAPIASLSPAAYKAEAAGTSARTKIRIRITVEDTQLIAELEDNSTAKALITKLPVTLHMEELYGREMCYRYGAGSLPTAALHDDRYEVGDIVYWSPMGSLAILYRKNGEEFSRVQVGHIASGVSVFESTGDVDVKFEVLNSN